MLNDTLKTTEVDRDKLLYLIGRFLGLFPENSFDQYKHVFESENDIQKMLVSIYRDLLTCGAILTVEGDKITWSPRFDIDTVLQQIERRKVSKAAEAQSRAKVKGIVRKYITPGQVITSDGLTVKVKVIDVDLLTITTIVQSVNDVWSKTYKLSTEITWTYNNINDGLVIFEDDSENLMYFENGMISFDKHE